MRRKEFLVILKMFKQGLSSLEDFYRMYDSFEDDQYTAYVQSLGKLINAVGFTDNEALYCMQVFNDKMITVDEIPTEPQIEQMYADYTDILGYHAGLFPDVSVVLRSIASGLRRLAYPKSVITEPYLDLGSTHAVCRVLGDVTSYPALFHEYAKNVLGPQVTLFDESPVQRLSVLFPTIEKALDNYTKVHPVEQCVIQLQSYTQNYQMYVRLGNYIKEAVLPHGLRFYQESQDPLYADLCTYYIGGSDYAKETVSRPTADV